MKQFATVLAVVLMLLVSTGAVFGVDPANLNRLTIANDTGFDILYLFVSPGDSDLWGADILGTTRTLDDGEELTFFVHYPDRSNDFDVLAIDVDGDAYLIEDYTVTDGTPASLGIGFDTYQGSYDLDQFGQVDLINDTGYDMWYIFFSPGDSQMWGIDMLGGTAILETGETLSLFVQVSSDADQYDFLGVDEDEDLYSFSVELSDARDRFEYLIEITDLQ